MTALRVVLFAEAMIACFLYARMVGNLWAGRGWAARVTLLGAAGILIYVTSGQIKAVQQDVVFDAYSKWGLLSVTVTDLGLMWLCWEQRRRERG